MEPPHDGERPLPAVPTRRYSGSEVEAILRRASLAETPLVSDRDRHDATLEDLMVAAAEAGLDPDAVRRAAAVVPPARGGPVERIVGASDRREASAFLEGASVPEDRGDLVRAAEAGLGVKGEVRDLGPGRFEWHARSAGGDASVELAERGGGTSIRVRTRRGGHYFGLWLLGLGGWAVLSALTPLGAFGPLAFAASLVAVPVILARPLWVRADRRVRHRLERTVLELARVVEDSGPGRPRKELPRSS